MGHLHVSKLKFRYPIRNVLSQCRANQIAELGLFQESSTCQDLTGADLSSDKPMWTSSSVPDEWVWENCNQPDSSENEDIPHRHQSTCELEGDAVVEDIINKQFISYTPLDEAQSGVKMVQSLIPIWEEENGRNGAFNNLPPESDRPLPQDVLRIVSDELLYGDFLGIRDDTEICSKLPSESLRSPLVHGVYYDYEHASNENNDLLPPKYLKASDRRGTFLSQGSPSVKVDATEIGDVHSADKLKQSGSEGPSCAKDLEGDTAMTLLNWLVSSQAMEDINSDDELIPVTIFSPKDSELLNRADVECERESQQECQDILDSIDFAKFEELDVPDEFNNSNETSLNTVIPQVDGSCDDLPLTLYSVNSPLTDSAEAKAHSEICPWPEIDSSLILEHRKKKPRWGSLPISSHKVIDVGKFDMPSVSGEFTKEKQVAFGTSCSVAKAEKLMEILQNDKREVGHSNKNFTVVDCSLRDLMRSHESQKLQISRHSATEMEAKEKLQLISDDNSEKGDLDPHSELKSDSEEDKAPKSPISKSLFRKLGSLERGVRDKNESSNEISFGGSSNSYCPNLGALPLSSKSICIGQNDNLSKDNLSPCVGSSILNHAPSSKSKNGGEHFDCSVAQDDGGLGSSVASIPVFDPVSNCNRLCGNSYQNSRSEINLMQVPAGDSKAVMRFETLNEKPKNVFLEAETELVAMTFSRKPPTIDLINGIESEVSLLFEKEDRKVGENIHDYPPFFTTFAEKEEHPEDGAQAKHLDANFEDFKQEDCAVGVPVTHRCDGSRLFLLGSALSPPSRESVDIWLSLNGSVTFGKRMNSPQMIDIGIQTDVSNLHASSQNCPDSPSPELHSSAGKSDFIQDKGSSQEICSTEIKSSDEICVETSPGSLPDASQISGPDKNSRPTPLSQIGFRDPASEGQGQQLTLLSLEVQVETRGNLRPNPRFDAINLIVLVIQEDDESKNDAILLLRCNSSLPKKNLDAVSEAKVLVFSEELELLDYFSKLISALDPDVLMGWDVQSGSLGLLAERAAQFGIDLLNNISRSPSLSFLASVGELRASEKCIEEETKANSVHIQNKVIDDEWGRTHASGVHVGGRIILNIWRLMRNEVKLNMYTAEAVAEAVLRRKVPSITSRVLTKWFASGPGQARHLAIKYTLERGKLNLQIMNQLDMINRTSELARVFGIDFFSVLSRGSQYRVESMLLRLAHTQNYLAISPGNHQVANQPAMECLPLVMEPESTFYADPVIVLDFQALYPSMVIAYNLCFCTCLGKILTPSKANVLGVSSYAPDPIMINSMRNELLITPNGVAYVPKKVCEGVLPRLLDEILSTRIMVKQAMKKLAPSDRVRQRILNARQLALKLIANVTYGYTAAGFSGRMPCAELADSIVQCGRRTLERAISFVNSNEKWKARVVYGDTDSMFVLVKGRSRQEAFKIGDEIATAVTEMNPNPIKLKMEKVYHPCFLLTKKRYVGYSFESLDQSKPTFDAKGIETVRRDTCSAVSKMMEQSLKLYFESQEIDKVKVYLLRQWTRILTDKVSLEDFIFAKEVRLGTYSGHAHSLPPAAIVAMKSMSNDPRVEPRYGERVPYIVVHGNPGSRLVDMVVDPHELLDIDSPLRLNDMYYITKQIIPVLQRVFGLVGVDLNQWFLDMPRPIRESVGKHHRHRFSSRTRIDYYYMSKHCILCGDLVHGSEYLCSDCSGNEISLCVALTGRTRKLENDIQHLNAICRHCGGGDWCVESGVKCDSLACPVFFQRKKVQKQLHSLSDLASTYGFYPKCNVEWF